MKNMTKEQASQLINDTADKLKKGGFNYLLFASKPTGKKMSGFAEQSIVAMIEALSPADFISALVGYAFDEPKFMGTLISVTQQLNYIIESDRQHDLEEQDNL